MDYQVEFDEDFLDCLRRRRSHVGASVRRTGEANREYCAVCRTGRGQSPAMLGDYSMRQGEADAVTMRFSREEGDENFFKIGSCDAWAGVGN